MSDFKFKVGQHIHNGDNPVKIIAIGEDNFLGRYIKCVGGDYSDERIYTQTSGWQLYQEPAPVKVLMKPTICTTNSPTLGTSLFPADAKMNMYKHRPARIVLKNVKAVDGYGEPISIDTLEADIFFEVLSK